MKNNIVEIHYYVDKINGRNNTNTFNELKKPPKINQSIIKKHILPFQRNFSSMNLQINCNGNKQIFDGIKSVKSSHKKTINLPKIDLFLTGNNVRAKSATKKSKENKNNDAIIKLNPKRKDIIKNVEKIHDMNRFYSKKYHIQQNNGNDDENKPFILEKINFDILKNVQIPFTLKDEKFRMTKFFKDFGQITKISFSPTKKV